jgi:ribosome-binding factor A
MKHKIERIKTLLKREVMSIISKGKLADPRIPQFMSISEVTVSKDLHYCHIYFTMVGDKPTPEDAVAGLNSASGYFQKMIGTELSLRYTPRIEFRYDTREVKAQEVTELLDSLINERVTGNQDSDNNPQKDNNSSSDVDKD